MTKFLLCCWFALTSGYAYAFWGEKTYQLKTCKTPSEAYQCSTCKEDFIKVQFSVNPDKSFVTMHIINNASDTFENCKIIDKKNWDCSEYRFENNWVDKKYRVMRNGIFTYIWEHGPNRNNPSVSATCGR